MRDSPRGQSPESPVEPTYTRASDEDSEVQSLLTSPDLTVLVDTTVDDSISTTGSRQHTQSKTYTT